MRSAVAAGGDQSELDEVLSLRSLIDSGAGRAIRRASGVSYREAAREADVSPTTIWRWEHQQRQPRGAAAVRYGRLLQRLAAR